MARIKDRWPELCKLVAVDDGLPVRASGPWAEDKLFFWNRYIDITTRAMVNSPKWPALAYVDLFAGPGICEVKEGGKRHRIPGSTLIAAHAPKPFSTIVACEKDRSFANALDARLAASDSASECHVIAGDCNRVIDDVCSKIPRGALTLAFVDPTGLHATFRTIEVLTNRRRVDLLILIADRMDIVRNVRAYSEQNMSKLDTFLGTGSNWRHQFRSLANQNAENVCDLFVEIYVKQLRDRLGYRVFGTETMRKSAKAPLYKILFASKNEKGLEFWNKVTKRERSGQQRLW